MTNQNNDSLKSALINAANGGVNEINNFFNELFNVKLFVPKRHQSTNLSNQADYPNDLVHLMGIKVNSESNVIPVFSKVAYIEEWSGNPFAYYELDISELCNKVPENWSIIINPGLDVEKELSPFEINELKRGKAGLDVVIAENLTEAKNTEAIEVLPEYLKEKESLLNKIIKFAQSNSNINEIYSLKEINNTQDSEKYLFGIETVNNFTDEENLKSEFNLILEEEFIGDFDYSIHIFSNKTSGMHSGLLKQGAKIYTSNKPTGLFAKIKSSIGI